MKKFFDEDLSMNELKAIFRKMRKKDDLRFIMLAVVGIVAAIGLIVFFVTKFIANRSNSCNFDDDDFDCDCEDCEEIHDENGCCYTDDEDFQE